MNTRCKYLLLAVLVLCLASISNAQMVASTYIDGTSGTERLSCVQNSFGGFGNSWGVCTK